MATPNLGITLPIDHGDLNAWGALLNDIIEFQIDPHDHTSGKGARIPAAGININADLSFAGFAAINVGRVGFSAVAALTSGSRALFVSTADNELYWRSNAGVNVKLTNGAALNVGAFVGGITGDYAAAGADLRFDDATDSYWFRQQVGAAVQQYARMRCADVDLYEYKAHPAAGVPTNRVRLASPAALAASYTLTMPGALPAATAALLVSATGVASFATSLPHGDLVLNVDPLSGFGNGAGITNPTGTTYAVSGGAGVDWFMPLPLATGDRIKSITWYYRRGAGTLTFALRAKTLATGLDADVGTPPTDAAGTTYTNITQAAINKTLVVGEAYYLRWAFSTTSATNLLYAVQVTYDRL